MSLAPIPTNPYPSPSPSPRRRAITAAVSDLEAFSLACYPHAPLRGYQLAIGLRIVAAALRGAGGEFALLFARQAGKDELLAQVQAFLLLRAQGRGGARCWRRRRSARRR